VVEGFYNGISTAEVDTLAAETCAYMCPVRKKRGWGGLESDGEII
jgi:hypothetical protein